MTDRGSVLLFQKTPLPAFIGTIVLLTHMIAAQAQQPPPFVFQIISPTQSGILSDGASYSHSDAGTSVKAFFGSDSATVDTSATFSFDHDLLFGAIQGNVNGGVQMRVYVRGGPGTAFSYTVTYNDSLRASWSEGPCIATAIGSLPSSGARAQSGNASASTSKMETDSGRQVSSGEQITYSGAVYTLGISSGGTSPGVRWDYGGDGSSPHYDTCGATAQTAFNLSLQLIGTGDQPPDRCTSSPYDSGSAGLIGANTSSTQSSCSCQIPTFETSLFDGWAVLEHWDTTGKWRQILSPDPSVTSFRGRAVTEHDAGHGPDSCYFPGSKIDPNSSITGGRWIVSANNIWGDDYVGGSPIVVDYYRRNGRAPCGSSVYQRMTISCPQGADRDYQTNTLIFNIGQSTVTSGRAGQAQTRTWP